MLTIAFTVSGQRDAYLKQVLRAWHKVRGIQDCQLVFSCEPWPQHFEFGAWAKRSFSNVLVTVNESVLGGYHNTHRALSIAAARSLSGRDFIVLAEEDVLPADDVVEYFTWAQERFAADPDVWTVCAHSYKSDRHAGPHEVISLPWFSPILWGTWEERWDKLISPQWGGISANPDAWDAKLRGTIQRKEHEGACSVFPVRSRSLHIGQVSTLMPPSVAEHFYKQSVSKTFAAHYGPGTYQLVATPADLVV